MNSPREFDSFFCVFSYFFGSFCTIFQLIYETILLFRSFFEQCFLSFHLLRFLFVVFVIKFTGNLVNFARFLRFLKYFCGFWKIRGLGKPCQPRFFFDWNLWIIFYQDLSGVFNCFFVHWVLIWAFFRTKIIPSAPAIQFEQSVFSGNFHYSIFSFIPTNFGILIIFFPFLKSTFIIFS